MAERGARTVALTGGTGFIGSAVARRLVASGWRLRLLVRTTARAESLRNLKPELVAGDLGDTARLRSFVEGADAVVHCAGAVRGITESDFNRVNAEGVANLARAAVSLDVPPLFIALSSLAAREPQLSPYAASKRAGEEALASAAAPMRWIALRPPAVYGPGDRELLPLFRWMMRGVAPILGAPDARFSMLYVDDLARAVESCLGAPNAPRGVFELHDGHPGGYTWGDLVSTAAGLRGRPVRAVPISERLLRALGSLSVRWARLVGQAPMLTPGKVRELRHLDWVCDNDAFTRASGWVPEIEFEEGLQRTLAAVS